jgi:predicted nucleic acid-binding Zn ribbon protein
MQHFDNNADEFDEEEPDLLDDDDLAEEVDDSEPTVACPFCRQEIYEDAQRCPHCERYISDDDFRKKRSWLIVIGAAMCLYIVYRWIVA